jgi:hypothetical protein
MKKLLGALLATGAIAVLAVSAATAGTTQVAGTQYPTADPAVSIMTGSLDGVWRDTTTTPDFRIQPSGTIEARGTEEFDGCMGSACGTLFFQFHAEIRINASFELVRGRCWHQVTGGTGAFAGASGVLDFRDDPANGCSYYKGHITLP